MTDTVKQQGTKYLRIATEEAFAPPELIARYRKLSTTVRILILALRISGSFMQAIPGRAPRS